MTRLRVHALGGLTLACVKRVIPVANSCRPVLGYLLTHRQRNVSRVELAEALWADQPGEQARHCLSTALWRLKRATGAASALICVHGEEISVDWTTALWVDCVAFELRVALLLRRQPDSLGIADLSRLERAVRLYRGDYLAGMDQEWAWIERQRLRTLYCDGLYRLITGHAAARRWSEVLHWGRCLTRVEPLREDVHRLLMLAHARTGNRASAIAQFRECERVLAAELGVAPMPETARLHQEIASSGDTGLGALSPATPLHWYEVRRRIGRVRKALAASQRQLDQALDTLDRPPSDSGQ
jgi:DNA-binding SARP family transcriptional activator